MMALIVTVQFVGDVKGGTLGGQLPVKTPSEADSMARTSSVFAWFGPQSTSNSCAQLPAKLASPVTGGSVELPSVGLFCDAPMPARAPENAAVYTVLLLGA